MSRPHPNAAAAALRRWALVLLVALVASLAVPPPAPAQDAPPDPGREVARIGHLEVLRYAGATRTDTARLIATDVATAGFDGSTVLVARADAFPDSLAGSYLAGVLDAPVLLTATDAVSPELSAALAAIDPDTVVLLGGQAALGDAVATALSSSYTVQRLAGSDRFATAAAIARQIGATPPAAEGLAVVASGEAFPDALAAGAIAAAEEVPLLLTGRDVLPEPTAAALRDLGTTEVVLAGGAAAVSPAVEQAITALGIDVVRAAGENRQATARALAELAVARFGWDVDRISLVSGSGFPDAIAMAPHAGLRAGGPTPLVLTGGDALGVETTAWLTDLAACDVMGLDVGGGQAAVPAAVVDAAAAALTPAGGCAPDDTAPDVAFTTPDEGAALVADADGITLAGTAADEGSGIVRVDVRVAELGEEVAGTAVPDADGVFDWTVDVTPADPGTYTFTATAVDGAGNEAVAERLVTVAHPAEDATLVFGDVRVLDATGRDCLSAVGEQDVLLTCDLAGVGVTDAPAGTGLEVGDVVVAEPTAAAPDGLLRRLGTCASEGPATRCAATPIPLTEVFARVDVTAQVPVTPITAAAVTTSEGVTIEPVGGGAPPAPRPIDPNVNRPAIITSVGFDEAGADGTQPAGPPAEPAGPAADGPVGAHQAGAPGSASSADFARRLVDRHWRTTFDVDLGEEAGLPIPLNLVGTLEAFFYVDLALDIDIEWCWFVPCGAEVEHFKAELGGGERLTAAYDLGGTAGGGDIRIDPIELGSIDLGSLTFTIGPIPVVISAELEFDIGVDGTIQGAISGRVTQSLTLATGIEYRDDDWHDLSRVDWDHDFSRVLDNGSVRTQIRPFVGVDLNLELYGVLGPHVRGEPYLLVDVDSARNPLFNLYLGFKASAGIEVDALGIDYEAELLDVRTLVATSFNYPPESPPSVTIVGPDGLLPVLDLDSGFAQTGTIGNPRQFFCCDVLLDYSADLSGAEPADQLFVLWTARNTSTGDVRRLGEADPDIARLTLPPGTWDITAQAATRAGDNRRGVGDTVRVSVSATPEIAVNPVPADDAGAQSLAAAATDIEAPDLVTGARFETPPTGDPAAHGTAGPGACEGIVTPDRVCPRGIPGLGSGAVLTTGLASAVNTERNPSAPASPGSQATVTDGVRGTSDTDVTVLAIDVDVPETASCLRFTYRFASEELPTYVGSRFDDVFVAEIDATTWTTADGHVVAPGDFARTDAGLPVTVNSMIGGIGALDAAHTTYEQGTRLLQAAVPVTPGAHTLYLSLFDQGDATYDSAVFIAGLEAVNAPAAACTSGAAPGPSGPFVG